MSITNHHNDGGFWVPSWVVAVVVGDEKWWLIGVSDWRSMNGMIGLIGSRWQLAWSAIWMDLFAFMKN